MVLAGCEDPGEDIKIVWADLERAWRQCDGPRAASLYSKDSIEWHARLIPIALDGTEAHVRGLGVHERDEVLHMRHLSTRAKLSAMDGRAYVAMQVTENWWGDYGDSTELFDIKVSGETASARQRDDDFVWEGRVYFQREDGQWKYDWVRTSREDAGNVVATARLEGMTVDQYLLAQLAEQSGRPVGPEIWQPMKK